MTTTNDIILNLPQGAQLSTLAVAPEFESYEELMQRAVVLLLTSDSSELLVDGLTLPQMLQQATSSGIRELRSLSGHFADALRQMLNTDNYEVDELTIDIGETFPVVVTINITKTNNTEISGEFTYE